MQLYNQMYKISSNNNKANKNNQTQNDEDDNDDRDNERKKKNKTYSISRNNKQIAYSNTNKYQIQEDRHSYIHTCDRCDEQARSNNNVALPHLIRTAPLDSEQKYHWEAVFCRQINCEGSLQQKYVCISQFSIENFLSQMLFLAKVSKKQFSVKRYQQ
ncbi:hypothetical protein FF38_00221 [Lucilia cuprina]|uniref:Uncharacterized protein n=1 Tax=Lucilia cuprina TaxID=7375 RepID=A0A0L0BVK5_LUCCU|nr:hypothetical protein FF38_00221 [Lucilia cuprina]